MPQRRDPAAYLGFLTLLKVSEKYQVDVVKRFVVAHLENDWPLSITEWSTQHAQLKQIETLHATSADPIADGLKPDDIFPEPAAAIRLAVDYSIPSILPAAFHCLSTINVEDDWDRHRSGSWLFGAQGTESAPPIPFLRRTARWSLLDRDNVYRLLIGRSELGRRIQRTKSNFGGCYSGQCAQASQVFRTNVIKPQTAHWQAPALGALLDLIEKTRTSSLCSSCKSQYLKNINDGMRKIWDDLPRIFSIDTLNLGASTQSLLISY